MEKNLYAAAASSIGYDYQIRLALLKAFQTNEEYEINIEALDDIEINSSEEAKILLSLKHKKLDDSLTDLSIDFWKSVNIWIDRITQIDKPMSFLLCTTAKVAENSILKIVTNDTKKLVTLDDIFEIEKILDTSENKKIIPIREKFKSLEEIVKIDLFNRITIIDESVRITDIPTKIQETYFRNVNKKFRENVYETLEGWWFSKVINKMTGKLEQPLFVKDISLKFEQISEQYFEDNLPITFNELTPEEIDISQYLDNDFLFVKKMRDIKLKNTQLQRAIFDFYRAYNQRVQWLEYSLVTSEEVSNFEKTIIDEWSRFKDDQYYDDDELTCDELVNIGRAIFRWAQNTTNILIRPKVIEPYVTRGSFHILADNEENILYWLPEIS